MLTYTKNITIKNCYNNEPTDNNEFDEFNFDLDCASHKNILLCNISVDAKNIETSKPYMSLCNWGKLSEWKWNENTISNLISDTPLNRLRG